MALRVAWRDVRRHKVRSALVLTLISLPVLLVSAGAIVGFTGDVRGVERIDRELGAVAEARIWTDGIERVVQQPDPLEGVDYVGGGEAVASDTPAAERLATALREATGDPMEVRSIFSSWTTVLLPDGAPDLVSAREADWSDPLLDGLVEVVEGRLPEAAGEVLVNDTLHAEGFDVGSTVEVAALDADLTVVGVVEDAAEVGNTILYGLPGALLPADAGDRGGDWRTQWLAGGDPVTWDEVQELNTQGWAVYSRTVVTSPPPDSEVEYLALSGADTGEQAEYVAVVAMIVTMVLLEVVLLAGPAFAVTARSHTRTLALVAASGGTPRQARRVILAGGLVLGLAATLGGLLLSVPVALLAMPYAQTLVTERVGPLEVPWAVLLLVATFGLASALLAAAVPAWLSSRQDVVAALAGRRSDGAPRMRVPLLGVVVLGLGVAGASYGAIKAEDHGPVLLSASAVVTMVGMVLVVPALVAVVARLAGRLPLPVRYATRDAARHRTRTVPAIAAVAATVAGVVALGITQSSDQLESRETYTPSAALGTGVISYDDEMLEIGTAAPWEDLRAAATGAVPDADVQELRGVEERYGTAVNDYWSVKRGPRGMPWLLDSWGSRASSSPVLVSDTVQDTSLGAADRRAVEQVLAAGEVALLSHRAVRRAVDEVTLVHRVSDSGDNGDQVVEKVTLPARVVVLEEGGSPWSEAVVPTSLEDRFSDGAITTVGLVVASELDEAEERAMVGAVRDVSPRADLHVERGHVRDPVGVILLWVLGVVGALLMLAGTLTATFLSLSDAKPDLATVSAVGGSPRTRRSVAASYALMIASVGAVLGALVGFVPGLALSRSITTAHWGPEPSGPYLDVPWTLIGTVVVALPLLSAVAVWLFSRSRLPMVARID